MKGRIVYQFLSGRIAPICSVGSRRTPVASICTFGSGTAFPEGTCEIAQVGLQREAAKSGGFVPADLPWRRVASDPVFEAAALFAQLSKLSAQMLLYFRY